MTEFGETPSPGKPSRRRFLLGASALATGIGAGSGAAAETRHQFSLAHLTVLGCAPPEMTYIAARAGYDFVSYRLLSMRLPGEPIYALTEDKALLRQTRTALSGTGLRVHDVELARIQDGLEPRSYAPELEIAAELGARQSSPASGLRTGTTRSIG